MIEAYAILNSDDETVYKVEDNIFSSIEEIFHDENADYLRLDAVDKYNLIQHIRDDAIDFLYPEDIDIDDVSDAFYEYLESLGDDVIDCEYTNGSLLYILNGDKYEITSAVLDILKKQIEE